MRPRLLLLSLTLFGGCSCHHDPDATALRTAAAEATAATAVARTAASAEAQASAAQVAGRDAAMQAARMGAVSAVHSYLSALGTGDRSGADRYWVGGRPTASDDAVLRTEPLEPMRIENEAPRLLDEEVPPRAIEVPVTVRRGSLRVTGWYRLRPRIDGSGWEITSASLHGVPG